MKRSKIEMTRYTLTHLFLSFAPYFHVSCFPIDEYGDYNGLGIIEWIRSHPQGFVHPSVRIGREIPGDPSSMMGLFVSSAPGTQPIEKDDIIARIPWSHMIGPGDEYDRYKYSSCQEIRNLAKELKLGEKSAWAPYIRYLLTQPRGTMPGEWSSAGKKFLSELLAHDDLPPYEEQWLNTFEMRWENECKGDPNDSMDRFAFYLASSRDEDTLMIPIYDMANHSNDPEKLNTLSFKPAKVGKPFRFEASRKIMPGEQIYNSYNRCNPCSDANSKSCETFSFQPTDYIFSHFGFIEDLPQYWIFDSVGEDNEDDIIEMCLRKHSESEKIEVKWIPDSLPDAADVEFLTGHLKRLNELHMKKSELEKTWVLLDANENSDSKMTLFEWNSIWKYHEHLVRAIDAAIIQTTTSTDEEEL